MLPIVEGEGSARPIVWPGIGAGGGEPVLGGFDQPVLDACPIEKGPIFCHPVAIGDFGATGDFDARSSEDRPATNDLDSGRNANANGSTVIRGPAPSA